MSPANTTEETSGNGPLNAKGLLLKFLKNGEEWPSPWSREWLFPDEMNVYVRKGCRYINGLRLKTLEIASVVVYAQNQGVFTDFFNYALSVCPYPVLLVESVQTEQFCRFFQRQGMLQLPDTIPPTFVWLNQSN